MLTFYDAKELWTIKIRQLQRAYLDTQLFSLFLKRERERDYRNGRKESGAIKDAEKLLISLCAPCSSSLKNA